MSKQKPIRVMFYDDGYYTTTGYGRVAKELSTRLAQDPKYEVFNLNIIDKTPMRVDNKVTILPIYGLRQDPVKTGYISSIVNTVSMIQPDVFIPICDAFFIDRDGLNKINFSSNIKFMPYVPIDSNHLGKGSIPTFQKSDRILVQSEFGKEEIEKEGFVSHVFRHGVNKEVFHPDAERRRMVRQRFGITDEKVFLFVGRNTKRKRIERLIRGFALFLKQNPDAKIKLIMHGSNYDDYANNIYERIESEETLFDVDILPHIIFPYKDHQLGQGVSDDKIVDLYHAADWTVSMSSSEGTGLMSLESFALGIPTIYPKNSNWKEILGQETTKGFCERGLAVESLEDVFVGLGCTQPLSSYDDLAKKLKIAYDYPEDSYKMMSENAINWVKENADWDTIVQELKLHIRKVRNGEQ